jgi:sulfur carrier protein
MARKMTISVNGQAMEVPVEITVAALLKMLHVEPSNVAVELDGSVERQEQWGETSISPGATLEIVRFVGGG